MRQQKLGEAQNLYILQELEVQTVIKIRLGIFVSDFMRTGGILDRLSAEKVGIFLVSNGIYHAVIREGGKESNLLSKKDAKFYVLSEDLQTRGFTSSEVDKRVSVITYDDMVDLMMGEYEKLAWL